MNSDMAENPKRVLLDTNVLVSALVYGGKPEVIFQLVITKRIAAVTSLPLLAEFLEVLRKKFEFEMEKIRKIERDLRKIFILVSPVGILDISRDEDDNRVLEAALEGGCDYIITGDEDLLNLGKFKNIKIITPDEFLRYMNVR